MKVSFQCANCNKKLEFSVPCIITLVCQECGCSDLSFSEDVLINPLEVSEVLEGKTVPKGEYILGTHKFGQRWKVDVVSKSMSKEVKEDKMDKDVEEDKKDKEAPTVMGGEPNKEVSPSSLLVRRKK